MNQRHLCVSSKVSDDLIRRGFEGVFNIFGNNVVENIELIGRKKIVYVSHAIYSASIESEDDIYEEFDKYTDGILTFGLYQGESWVYEAHEYWGRPCLLTERFHVCYAENNPVPRR